ncbi:hypothetical protein BGX26_010434 [Mortierella sp. AD094]|nr:hypothetical protein BGX26_010434 [Mortierella sp. AD094]
MLPPTSDPSFSTDSHVDHVDRVSSLADAPSIAEVLDSNDPAVRALFQAAVAHQQATEAAAAAAAAAAAVAAASVGSASTDTLMDQDVKMPIPDIIATATTSSSLSATSVSAVNAIADAVPADILKSLMPSVVTSMPITSASEQPAASTSAPDSVTIPVSSSAPATVSTSPSDPVHTPTHAPVMTSDTISTTVTAPTPATASSSPTTPSSSSSTSSAVRPFVSTKRFNPDDIFCLGCCRNLSVDHYTCPNTNRIFKSCNACRQKSRINSKKVTKPATVPTKPTISMEEFAAKLRELEATQEESSLDVMVRLEGSVEMDPETLKARGAQIAAQVYESTGYWFSHSRTNDETQSKTRLKIYGCSQREDRRAPPAPKTQSRKRNRPSTKSYFPCKGNLTMTFYHNMNHVRVVYGHKRHAKYDNRKCPDHVRAFVKENLGLAPRQLYDTLIEANPGLGITQAQVRYWSHFYKKNMDQDENSGISRSDIAASDPSLLGQSISGSSSNNGSEHNDQSHIGTREGSPSQLQLQQQTDEEREQHERVQQLILASNAAALQSLAQSHQVSASLVGGTIAISVPMSDMDTSPLASSIVQRVLSEGGKGLLDLQASLRAVSDAASVAGDGGDAVVQQVTAFMKENDQQQQLLEQQQQQQQQQQVEAQQE